MLFPISDDDRHPLRPAYAAHIGGFMSGVMSGVIAHLTLKTEPDTPFRRIYERRYPR